MLHCIILNIPTNDSLNQKSTMPSIFSFLLCLEQMHDKGIGEYQQVRVFRHTDCFYTLYTLSSQSLSLLSSHRHRHHHFMKNSLQVLFINNPVCIINNETLRCQVLPQFVNNLFLSLSKSIVLFSVLWSHRSFDS